MDFRHGCFSARLSLLACLLGSLMGIAFGCGIKAMPVVPGRSAPPAVSDLTGVKTEGNVQLTWTVPHAQGKNEWAAEAVVVYRAGVSLQNGGCDHCPLRFAPIARLPVSAAGDRLKMHHLDTPDAGSRYTYKVVPVSDRDEMGLPSNLIEIDP